jgi:AraC-like DNA-binding protein
MKAAVSKTCLIGPDIAPEQFVAEHLFFYLVKGSIGGYYGDKGYTLTSGEYGIARKNRLGRLDPRQHHEAEKVIFVFDEPFLKAFQEKHGLVAAKFNVAESFLRIAENKLIPDFIHSLLPYYNEEGKMDKAFFDVKREELLLILLQGQPELSGVFFDYGMPSKIDLERFMNRNYTYNVSMERFAYLTGRSLSAFKRDFKQIFNDTPNRWLVQRRLREAHFLIVKKNMRPVDIFLDLGFEDLSHFSYAFKKLFGLAPTELVKRSSEL